MVWNLGKSEKKPEINLKRQRQCKGRRQPKKINRQKEWYRLPSKAGPVIAVRPSPAVVSPGVRTVSRVLITIKTLKLTSMLKGQVTR